ncbi:hypothetical protein D9756_007914 [Leucocoprinus leucothites]|uniref:Transmembrane protein n=1 Tax=Leucocoprinus leucothites TaxID=201217 RepID=A0A8H5FYH8_9AGAR|nr:hypothetical protein D9756_007914 [Leucoagaricus leucothites]
MDFPFDLPLPDLPMERRTRRASKYLAERTRTYKISNFENSRDSWDIRRTSRSSTTGPTASFHNVNASPFKPIVPTPMTSSDSTIKSPGNNLHSQSSHSVSILDFVSTSSFHPSLSSSLLLQSTARTMSTVPASVPTPVGDAALHDNSNLLKIVIPICVVSSLLIVGLVILSFIRCKRRKQGNGAASANGSRSDIHPFQIRNENREDTIAGSKVAFGTPEPNTERAWTPTTEQIPDTESESSTPSIFGDTTPFLPQPSPTRNRSESPLQPIAESPVTTRGPSAPVARSRAVTKPRTGITLVPREQQLENQVLTMMNKIDAIEAAIAHLPIVPSGALTGPTNSFDGEVPHDNPHDRPPDYTS